MRTLTGGVIDVTQDTSGVAVEAAEVDSTHVGAVFKARCVRIAAYTAKAVVVVTINSHRAAEGAEAHQTPVLALAGDTGCMGYTRIRDADGKSRMHVRNGAGISRGYRSVRGTGAYNRTLDAEVTDVCILYLAEETCHAGFSLYLQACYLVVLTVELTLEGY